MPPRRLTGNQDLTVKRAAKPEAPSADGDPVGAMFYFAVLTVIFGLATSVSIYRLWSVPEPLPVNGSLQRFSEGRALQHVKALTDFGPRQVGSPELDAAAHYLINEGRKLVKEAERSRPDLLVQVDTEFVSGAMESTFLNSEYINMYNNLTNIVLVVSPRAGLREKSVLVNAHFDSTLGTTGASDDAASVGVTLEMARTLIANRDIQLASPVMFLMNGGEEALCPAAHGFMQQSPWAQDAGVFLNLESTGPLGPDFVFQHTGKWPMQAFSLVAPFPRGSVTAQDFFELGVVPADTDYRMFSAKLKGRLPGIDTAFLLGAGMYHTDRDCYDNLRPGTLQAMGQNSVAVVEEWTKQLALRRQQGMEETDTEKTIFFDVLGLFMVVYPFSWARVIHPTPLVLTLGLPFLQKGAFRGRSLARVYAGIALETLVALSSILSGVLCCAFIGILRVTSLGAPMAWYGDDVMPYAILVPSAIGGLLLPYLGRRVDVKLAALGNMVAHSLLATALTSAGLGASFVGAIWAFAGLITMTDMELSPKQLLKRATINCVWPVVMMLPNAIALSSYVLQKSSFMGAQGQPDYTVIAADGVAGIVVGLATISVFGFLTPWIAYASGRTLRRTVLLLFCVSIFFAGRVSLGSSPYTELAPKKVIIQHLHEHSPSGSILRSVFAVGSVDSVPVNNLLGGKDPQLWAAQKSGWEWLTLYPLGDQYIQSTILQAPPPITFAKLPTLELRNRTSSGAAERISLQLHLPGPDFLGCLMFRGEIVEWSLPELELLQVEEGKAHDRYVRFVGNGRKEHWRFWVDVVPDSSLSVRLSAASPAPSPAVAEFVDGWPAWTFVVGLTTFASSWMF